MDNRPIIFVLDDDITVLKTIKQILVDDNGYDVHMFDNAVDLLANDLLPRVDLLIIDVSLKDKDGRVVYNDVCSIGMDIPALFVSRILDDSAFDNLECAYVYDFMPKPFPSNRIFINRVKLLLKVSSKIHEKDKKIQAEEQKLALIAKHKREAELEKDRLNVLFEAVLEQIPFGIDVIEKNGHWRVVKSSAKSKEITGEIDLESVGDLNLDSCKFNVFDSDGNTIDMQRLPGVRSFLYDEYVDNEELFVVREDGTEVYVSFKSVPVKDKAGKTIAGLQISFDITEYKLMENSLKNQQSLLRTEIEKRLDSWKRDISSAGARTQFRIKELNGAVDKKIKESMGA